MQQQVRQGGARILNVGYVRILGRRQEVNTPGDGGRKPPLVVLLGTQSCFVH